MNEKRQEKHKKGFNFKRTFVTGLLLILPLYITFFLLKLVVIWLRSLLHDTFHLSFGIIFGKTVGEFYSKHETFFLFLIGLPIVIGFITGVGWAAKYWFGKRALGWAEENVMKIPIVGGVYSGAKQLIDTLFVKGKEKYKRVVLVEYPRKGCWVLGFITGESSKEIKTGVERDEEQIVNIFVPTTPNPTSGFLVFFKQSEVVPLDISVEDGMKMLISGGILKPEDMKGKVSMDESVVENDERWEK